MGYSLTIGEAELCWSHERVSVFVPSVKLPDAPAFGEPTDHTNERWPSYTAWADFCRNIGIVDLMFNGRNGGCESVEYQGETIFPLIQQHPGVAPITRLHYLAILEKVDEYKSQNPGHIAKFPPPKPDAKPLFGNTYSEDDLSKDPQYDPNLCRAEWLLFWLKWSLENCERPAFSNS